jgi:hypothetical protein
MFIEITQRQHQCKSKNFCEILSNTNIILLDITHRYDLIETSCVSKEIQSYNRKLKKVVKLYKHVTILEASNNREDFTRKDLYLNKAGKRQLVMKIANAVMEVTEEKVNNTICLDWKYVTKKPIAIRLGEKQQNHSIIKKQYDTKSRRCSTRTKKLPVHRSSDFLWEKEI